MRWYYLHSFLVRGICGTLLLLFTGCGPRVGAGEMAAQLRGSPLVVDLPALYIDYDRAGQAFIGTVPVTALGDAFGVNLALLNLDAAQMQMISAANIHHLQVTNTPTHLRLLVNGRTLPALRWTPESLANAGTTLQQLLPGLEAVAALLPVVVEMGGGVVLRFPVADGVAPLPEALIESDGAAITAAQAAYLRVIGAPPQIVIDVFYRDDGTWMVDDLDEAAWRAALPLPWERLTLRPAQIQNLRAGGINTLVLKTNREGIFVQINDQPLPHLSWVDGELNNVVGLAAEAGLFRQLLGDTPTAASLATTLEQLLPMLQVTELELRVHFAADNTATSAPD
jgi:hypothetical protein